MSEDFDHLLKAFFRLHPWDGFYKEIIDEVLTDGTSKRNDVKYLNFSIEELKKIMPARSIKLQQLLGKDKTCMPEK